MTASRSLTPQTYHSICLFSISPQYIISSTISVTGIPNCDCSSIAHCSSLPLLTGAWLDDLSLRSFSCFSTIRFKHLSDILRTGFNTDVSCWTTHIELSGSLGCDWKNCFWRRLCNARGQWILSLMLEGDCHYSLKVLEPEPSAGSASWSLGVFSFK